ncbi:gamma-glutamylcyclotransferase [Klebsiella pneumoniae]|nr:gamma-glutamylcyclotransferase [Klebsiella pneumoniae]
MRIVRQRLALLRSLLWSAEQRAASLAATLYRPDDGSVWIFGYGSLIWNRRSIIASPAPAHCRAGAARLHLRLTAGRGSACQPGRMLALKRAAEPPASPIVCLTTRWRRS